MKPYVHAKSSAKRYGGQPEDYMDIHELMDSSKACLPSNLHRFLAHNSWFIKQIIPRCFGHERVNSDGRKYCPENVAEDHVLEDYKMKFIPSPQDFLENVKFQPWMNGVGVPNSCKPMEKS